MGRSLEDDPGLLFELSFFSGTETCCQDDPRFNALTAAGERKQAFAEYITQKKKRETLARLR